MCWLPWQRGHKTTNGIFFLFLLLICETLFIEVARVSSWEPWKLQRHNRDGPSFHVLCLLSSSEGHHPTLISSHILTSPAFFMLHVLCSKPNVTCSVCPRCIFLTVSGLPTHSGFDIVMDLVVHAIYFIGLCLLMFFSLFPQG